MNVRINDLFVEKEYRLTTSIRELAEDIVCDILSKIFNQSNKDFGIVD